MRTSEVLDEHKRGILSEAVRELKKQENIGADTVRGLEHQLQMQHTEISRQSYDYEHSQRQQAHLVAEIRDQDDVHQEHLAQMKRIMGNLRPTNNLLTSSLDSWYNVRSCKFSLDVATGLPVR